jgi:hypothetical protein
VPTPAAITPVEYGGLQAAYEFFNAELLDGALPNVFITYQRRARMLGYFHAERFIGRPGTRDDERRHSELALNPDGFINRSDRDVLSTLLHEMVHVWEVENGTAPKRHYHNKIWAAKMKAVGLYPSNSGMVGGRETGVQIHHYILDGGPFDRSYDRLRAKAWRLNLQSAPIANPAAAPKNKAKFTCPHCEQTAWGKPDLALICKPCGVEMPRTK